MTNCIGCNILLKNDQDKLCEDCRDAATINNLKDEVRKLREIVEAVATDGCVVTIELQTTTKNALKEK